MINPKIYHLFMINKAGGLIFVYNFNVKDKLNSDDYLQMASTFHSLHAISATISPVKDSSGVVKLQTKDFTLTCFQALTGVKFFVTTVPGTNHVEEYLNSCYQIYSDFVLKDPFYEIDMPIKSNKFNQQLLNLSKTF